MAEQKERMVSVRGALGMYHSVPESQVAQYLKDQKELQDSGELQRQNEALRERVDYWRGQTRLTAAPTLRQGDIDRMARGLVKDYASTADAGEIGAELKRLGEYILRNGEGSDELTFSAVKERAVGIAQTLVENAEELAEKDGDLRHDLRGVLQQPMVISALDAHDVAPEWGPWRNARVTVQTGRERSHAVLLRAISGPEYSAAAEDGFTNWLRCGIK